MKRVALDKELPKKFRILINIGVALFISALIGFSYLCFSKQAANQQQFDWWSNLLINIAAGTATTVTFLFISKIKERRYRLMQAIRDLSRLIIQVNNCLRGIRTRLRQEKESLFLFYLECTNIKIDNDIIKKSP